MRQSKRNLSNTQKRLETERLSQTDDKIYADLIWAPSMFCNSRICYETTRVVYMKICINYTACKLQTIYIMDFNNNKMETCI